MSYELADRTYGTIQYGIPFAKDMGTVTVTPEMTVVSGMPDASV
jgi:hypothetical protein